MSEEQDPRTPAYVPRSYCQAPDLFGRNATAAFEAKRPGRQHAVWAQAARLQHLFAVAVRGRLGGRSTMKALAEKTGIKYHRLSRLLNGHLPIRLAEMAVIAHVVGLEAIWHPEAP